MRSTVRDSFARNIMMVTRGVLKKARDKMLWQEVDVALFAGEVKEKVERIQQYGFTSFPLPEKDDKDKHPAEALVMFLGGNRAHAIVLAVDDRRHRLLNMREGESAVYDHKDQRVYVWKDGIEVLTQQKIVNRIVHKPDEEEDQGGSQGKKDGSKQDAQKKRMDFTRIVHDKDSITLQILDKEDDTLVVCYIRLDRDGITAFGPMIRSIAGIDITEEAGRDITEQAGRDITSEALRDYKGTAIQREAVITAPKVITDGETHLDRGDAIVELYLDTPASRVFAK